ncbi:MAG: hypothetical protein HYX68_13665 [Planctomycetes bacterium]|nr:hypothetical protein [Planctomycetota bacterium]
MSPIERALKKNQIDLASEVGPFFESLIDHYHLLVHTEFLARCRLRIDPAAAEYVSFIQMAQDFLIASSRIAGKIKKQYPQDSMHHALAQGAVLLTADLLDSYLTRHKNKAC